MNPTELVLQFSDFPVIFYAIYKKQEKANTIGVTLLQERPWTDFGFCNVVPGAGSGGPAAIQAGDRRIPAGGWRSGLGTSRVRFGAWLVRRGRPAGACRGCRWSGCSGVVGGSGGLCAER
jgi:hypothetical protein